MGGLLGVLLGTGLLLVWLALSDPRSPASGLVDPVRRRAAYAPLLVRAGADRSVSPGSSS